MPSAGPNFFVAGAAKAGTTFWYRTLGEHPEVYVPEVKEPRFLDPDQTYTHRVEEEARYRSLYEPGASAPRRGDFSPWYLHSEVAPQRIRDITDDPRVLIILRDPVERIYSHHSQRLLTGNEHIEDFEAAVAAARDRRRGKRLPERYNPLEGLYYVDAARYAPHLERWMDAFDENELKVLRFTRFTDDPAGTYREVCRFLGIDPNHRPTITKANPNQVVRSPWLRDHVREPPAPVLKVAGLFPRAWRQRARQAIKRVNRKTVERARLDPAFRARLIEELRDDIERVEELTGWDLSDWKQAS